MDSTGTVPWYESTSTEGLMLICAAIDLLEKWSEPPMPTEPADAFHKSNVAAVNKPAENSEGQESWEEFAPKPVYAASCKSSRVKKLKKLVNRDRRLTKIVTEIEKKVTKRVNNKLQDYVNIRKAVEPVNIEYQPNKVRYTADPDENSAKKERRLAANNASRGSRHKKKIASQERSIALQFLLGETKNLNQTMRDIGYAIEKEDNIVFNFNNVYFDK